MKHLSTHTRSNNQARLTALRLQGQSATRMNNIRKEEPDHVRRFSGVTLINRRTLLAIVPVSDRTIYNLEKRGEFPRRIVLTSRKVAWDLAEVEHWIEERRQSDDQADRPGWFNARR